ncbi:hypothetical protein PUNSTDRAFT_60911 [Punctularia strigosozonata HHB-11173 SS5]|uniref:uncharacterized protein n=1 Tax=Punctularia strigosozonata (strain HHB-11173) TaxID=741275 RepID=UPI0004417220|nr:uncharacterized protein PUNSTDRAFT_60911 [Punctularia strigosozonata HHB-11173 SS5]EIN12752.1 hypothetical protein PUNSTDRAFT_60911 [Punctularia strigosozonata HHB-11173 SS5]
MSFAFDDATTPAWGPAADPIGAGDLVKDAIRKEQVIKDIAAAQNDLRALVDRVKAVQTDVDKLSSGNQTLQMYIDNLTMQMAKRR